MAQWKDNPAIKNFVDYLQIPSVQPDVNYDECLAFLKKQAAEIGLSYRVYECAPKKPIAVLTWEGTDPALPSCLLNSHMDVVPVFPDSWTYPPFSAHIDDDGKIFARGSQDMKCVGIQYLETVRRLKSKGVTLRRTLHICFVPDEEIGGKLGMALFVHTQDFRDLNVGVALDEGIASPTDDYLLFYAERNIWHIIVTCPGTPGHGSLLLENTAGEKVRYIVDKFMDFRAKEKKRLEANPNFTIGNVTSVNLTRLFGGVQTNVIPETLTVVFDVRLTVDVDHEEFENMVLGWCKEAGEGVTIEFEQKNPKVGQTRLDESNIYWMAFKKAADEMNINLLPRIFPGGTDSRYVRGLGLPAIGFSPMINTPVLLHDHDEFLQVDVFLKGIDIYEKLIPAVANA